MRQVIMIFLSLLIIVSVHACKDENQVEDTSVPGLNGKEVVMIVASHDFRDEELKEPKSILEGNGVEVTIASTTEGQITGMKGMKITPDILLDQVIVDDYDAIVFIGGSGAQEYWNNAKAHSIAQETVASGKILGAICIAPVTLANAGVLNGRKATVYSSESGKLKAAGATYTGADVEVDGKIITANGPDAASEFGMALARALGEP